MPLSVDNIIQQNTGSAETSGTVTMTLPAGVTAGTFVLICAVIDGNGTGIWELDVPNTVGTGNFADMAGDNTSSATMCKPYIWGSRDVAAGATSWTTVVLTSSGAQQVVWAVFELTGVGQNPYGYYSTWGPATAAAMSSAPLNIMGSDTAVATRSTDVTLAIPAYDWLSFAVHGVGRNDTTVPTISGHTNGYIEIASVNRTNASSSVTMSVSYLPGLVAGTTECTASLSPSSATYATVVTLFADGAKFAPDVACLTGYEFGTATGLTNKSALQPTTSNFDNLAGTPEIVSTHPRTGSWCLKLSSSAAAEYVTWEQGAGVGALQNQMTGVVVRRRNIYFETSLPSADVPLFSWEADGAANSVVFWFRNSSSKIGCKVGTGTEVLSDTTVSTGHWIGIDYRYDARTTTHTCDWQIDYNSDTSDTTGPVAQTQATNTGMTANDGFNSVDRTGWADARTATVFYDDEMVATHWGSYPLGDHRILAVGPDQAGTPTISGTSTNFKTFTANGTLATWTAATTRAVLNDIPPVIGASADGLAQVTAASNDYCEIPMGTFTCAPNYVPRAARWYTAGWAVSTTACTNGTQILDVIDPMNNGQPKWLVVQGDHGLDNALLVWMCCMHKNSGFYLLTQAKIDAMRLRWGFSTDATPDVGLHCVFYELAYAPADVIGVASGEDGTFTIYTRQDPISGAPASYLGTTPAGTRGMTMYGTIDGVDWSQYVGPNTTGEKVVGAADISHVTAGPGMTPDPSPPE